MRLKFRAWDKNRKVMRTVNVISFVENVAGLIDGYTNSLDNLIIMQSTGLKDVNGVEIYESHIVKERWSNQYGEHERTQVVKWNEKTLGWNIFNPIATSTSMNYEIIGNIYENPALLKGDEHETI
ncbi:YopX family protein [Macrococcus equipercicus]|uniref:YopX protein domain-containing protein n=1 Tax=Macrococcus equipercicus TaxID=69967 RepID=A0A9Q9F107_9STAP|nr:YopX family protein [Macrococcus equipercicus]UTH13315.1 hypothetical protein KFV11_08585 [Macrococcus equipercicus]